VTLASVVVVEELQTVTHVAKNEVALNVLRADGARLPSERNSVENQGQVSCCEAVARAHRFLARKKRNGRMLDAPSKQQGTVAARAAKKLKKGAHSPPPSLK
jgi:hypothetical protein